MPPRQPKKARFTQDTKQYKLIIEMLKNGTMNPEDYPATLFYENPTKFEPFTLSQFRGALAKAKEELGMANPKKGKVDCCLLLL